MTFSSCQKPRHYCSTMTVLAWSSPENWLCWNPHPTPHKNPFRLSFETRAKVYAKYIHILHVHFKENLVFFSRLCSPTSSKALGRQVIKYLQACFLTWEKGRNSHFSVNVGESLKQGNILRSTWHSIRCSLKLQNPMWGRWRGSKDKYFQL